ncbi:MAG: hypothetical protein DDG59_11925 [Anaerolineae bacterium]|nr:MAG: hypothetical protein DDG59_11925 [Anaerolineae bacterium]
MLSLRVFTHFALIMLVVVLLKSTIVSFGFEQELGVVIGVHLRPTVRYYDSIIEFNSSIRKQAGIVMYFLDWSGQSRVSGQVLDDYLIKEIERIPVEIRPAIMLTWQPMMLSSYIDPDIENTCRPSKGNAISIETIKQGHCDKYIRQFAKDLTKHPSSRFLIRFAHEMNISDSPWYPFHFNETPSDYVDMWRHVHEVFTQAQKEENIDNVEWVWSINYASYPSIPSNEYYLYYPGDNYVDWIGLSGYNWYTARNMPNMEFENIYGNVGGENAIIQPGILHDLACKYRKPQIVTEIGTHGSPSEKARWINNALKNLPNYPFLRGFVWFNDFAYANSNDADFRITGQGVDPAITTAFRGGVNSAHYYSKLPSLEDVIPPSTYCGKGETQYKIPDTVLLEKNSNRTQQISLKMILPETDTLEIFTDGFVNVKLIQKKILKEWGEATLEFTVNETQNLSTSHISTVSLKIGTITIPIKLIIAENINSIFLPITIK